MKKKHFRFLSLVFFILGIIFLLNQKINITGSVIGMSGISSTFNSVFGIIFLIVSVMFIGAGEWVSTGTLDELLKGKASKRHMKTASHLGKSHLRKGGGDLPTKIDEKTEKATYKELFACIEMEKHPNNPNVSTIHNKYMRHNIKNCELGKDLISYDALELSTKHRGKYRYIFDKGKYLGLAIHEQSKGKYKYKWA